jgi:PAS domain S-box-containing protein
MWYHDGRTNFVIVMMASGIVLVFASLGVSRPVLFDRTGLVDAYSIDPASQSIDAAANVKVGPPRLSWFDSLKNIGWQHNSLSGVHRFTHVVAATVTSLCLLSTAAVLLFLFTKNRSPTIGSLLQLLCALMVVNGITCLVHVLTIWWPANHLDAALRATSALVSVGIVIALVRKLPIVISFHGRASLKTAENELRQSKERFERALSGSSNGLWEWNIEAGEVWYAPRFRELIGYSEEEFPNELASWESRLHPEDRSKTLMALENHLEREDAFDVEYRLLTKSGEYRWFHARGVAIRDPSGKPYLMAGSIQDIHVRKQAQEHLRDRDEQLRHAQKLEAVGTLAGGIAHEFNNLIQAIQGYTMFAMDGLDRADQRHEDLTQVLVASKRAADLTKQLLGFSRRQVLKLESIPPNPLMKDLVKLIRPLIGENITIELALDPDTENILADAGHIQQLIMNLCINARDAMPSGGILKLGTRSYEIFDGNCASSPNLAAGRYVAISVSDDGCGIPDDLRNHIFEPFFTTKGIGKGTGLGLAMAYGIVQQHNGLINVESHLSKGTTFTVYLPAAEAAPTKSDELAGKSHRGGEETILVAEDDAYVRNLAVRILQQAGYNTLVANDGAEAANMYQANHDQISLVLLDAMMPKLDGHDALRRIRAINPDVPALMCTGYDPETMCSNGSSNIQVPLIQKPFEPDCLLQSVREVLDGILCLAN